MCVCVYSLILLCLKPAFFFLKEAARIQALFVSKFLFSFDQSLLGSGSGGDIKEIKMIKEERGRFQIKNNPSEGKEYSEGNVQGEGMR